MNKIQFQHIIKVFYKGTNEIKCDSTKYFPENYTIMDLKSDALKYGYNYRLTPNGELLIKLTVRQEQELKMMP